jgi:hypothetical protein
MRGISLLLLGATLASCMTGPPPPPTQNARAAQELQQLLAGKVARPEISCLQSYNTNDMTVIDGRTLAFRRGTGTVYLAHLSPGCELLSPQSTYALLSRQFGNPGTCRGDIQQVIDTTNRITVGSCTIEAIIPYVRAGA